MKRGPIETPEDFKAIWPGCMHLDCVEDCDIGSFFCARLDQAMREWNEKENAQQSSNGSEG
jgi:hypothetical protein